MLHTTMESRIGGGSPCLGGTVEETAVVCGTSIALSHPGVGDAGGGTCSRTHYPIGSILTLPVRPEQEGNRNRTVTCWKTGHHAPDLVLV